MTESSDLQPLVTQCPSCHTQFRVNEAQLQVAGGKVRCGACLTVFQGVDNLIWEQNEVEGDADVTLDDLLEELTRPDPPKRDVPAPTPTVADAQANSADHPHEDASAEPETITDTATEADLIPEPVAADPADALAAAVAATLTGATEDAKASAATAQDLVAPAAEAEDAVEVEAAADLEDAADKKSGADKQRTADTQSAAAKESAAKESAAKENAAAQEAAAAKQAALANKAAAAKETTPTQATTAAKDRVAPAQAAAEIEPTPAATTAAPAETAPHTQLDEEPDPFARLSANKSDELPTPGPERGWLLYAVSAGGVLLLLLQVLIFRFDAWTQNPTMRPIYTALCAVSWCEVPPLQALEQMESRNLTVRTHPSVENALMVDTVIVNNAEFPQVFPVIELTFTDIQGKVVAGRRFEPEEYLAGELKGAKSIASRTPVRIKLEIKDPGKTAVSYKMDFR